MKNFCRLVLTLFVVSLLVACTAAAPSPTAAPPAPTNTTVVEPTTAPHPADAPTEETAPTEEPTAEASTEGGELIVFAAASLTNAFEEIGALFESQHEGTTITFNFAGSQQLAQQLGQGAPADVFASANKSQMDVAVEASRVVTGTQQNFVRNRLVVIYPNDNPGGVSTLQDLAKPGLKLIFAAAEVPVGQYSLDFLDKAVADPSFDPTFKDTVLVNVVSYEDNVRSVLSKIALGEGDAGIVYTSDVSGEGSENVSQLEIPDELNTIASYPIAPVSDSEKPELAQAFIDLVASPEGQQILANYGFISITVDSGT